jgi:hypothetical protein
MLSKEDRPGDMSMIGSQTALMAAKSQIVEGWLSGIVFDRHSDAVRVNVDQRHRVDFSGRLAEKGASIEIVFEGVAEIGWSGQVLLGLSTLESITYLGESYLPGAISGRHTWELCVPEAKIVIECSSAIALVKDIYIDPPES